MFKKRVSKGAGERGGRITRCCEERATMSVIKGKRALGG